MTQKTLGTPLEYYMLPCLKAPSSLTTPPVSALRIATAYDYPDLCSYATKYLESADLTAIERIKVAREFGLTSWEEPAYLKLCERDEPVTNEEASALGMDAFVRIDGIREREQRRRGRELDGCQGQSAETEALNKENRAKNESMSPKESQGNKEAISSSQGDAHTVNAMTNPSFIGVQTGGIYADGTWTGGYDNWHLPVSDCTCRFDNGTPCGATTRCKLPPCAVAAFKNLQVQQIAHGNSITNLEQSMDKFNASLVPTPESPAKAPNPSHDSIREEVRLMLKALRGT